MIMICEADTLCYPLVLAFKSVSFNSWQSSINDINPNAPIGTVICTIHNPMHNETLKALRKTYPDKIKVSEFPNVKHKFEVIGRIYSFQRAIAHDADTTKPDISLTAVRINVESLTLKE